MSNKPWEYLFQLEFKKLYIRKKIEDDYILDTLLRRISVPTSYYVLNKLKISANAITFFFYRIFSFISFCQFKLFIWLIIIFIYGACSIIWMVNWQDTKFIF